MDQITKASDKLTKKYIINRISDIPGGVSVVLSTLVAGSTVLEGTPLTAPSSGLRTICKQAIILAGSTTTIFRVETKTHNFKTGDFVMQGAGGVAYACTVAIAVGTASGITYDTITVGTALESAVAGTVIYEAAAASTGLDDTLNIAYANDTASGLTDDATSDAIIGAVPDATIATVAGTVGAAGAGDVTVTVSSDLFDDVVLSVAVANDDTATIAAGKFRQAMQANAILMNNFEISGEGVQVILARKVAATGAVLENAADVIIKEAFTVPSNAKVIFIADAFIRADVVENAIGALYLASLDVNEIKR